MDRAPNVPLRDDLARLVYHQSKLFLKHLLQAVSHLHSLHVSAAALRPHPGVDTPANETYALFVQSYSNI